LQPFVRHEDLPALLAQLDVFVVPSHQEGLCIAALEAMACGVPVVTTRCGGPEEFVVDGQTGYQTDSNAEALASTLARILTDGDSRRRLGEGARRLVETSYSQATAESVLARALAEEFQETTGSHSK
jgi:glycosyltransferase involved in cell wall biosynthesis